MTESHERSDAGMHLVEAARLRDGIPMSAVVWRELEALVAERHVPFDLAVEPD